MARTKRRNTGDSDIGRPPTPYKRQSRLRWLNEYAAS